MAIDLESEVAEILSISENRAKRRTKSTLEKSEIRDTHIRLFRGVLVFLCYIVYIIMFICIERNLVLNIMRRNRVTFTNN